jgi:hypothetical protein
MFVNVFCFPQKQDKISGAFLRYLPMNTRYSTRKTVCKINFCNKLCAIEDIYFYTDTAVRADGGQL